MLGYNPVVAKTEETQVFRDVRPYSLYPGTTRQILTDSHTYQYKSTYDLLRDTEPAAGRSRRTRRAANELKSMIEFSAPGPSTASAPLKPIKRKPTTEKWEPLSVSAVVVRKGKGKEKESPIDVEEQGVTGRRSPKKSARKRVFATMEAEEVSAEPPRSQTAPPRNRPGRSLSLRLGPFPEDEHLDDSILVIPRTNGAKRRRDTLVEPCVSPDLSAIAKDSKQKRHDAAKSDKTKAQALEAHGPQPILSPRTLRLPLPHHERITSRSQRMPSNVTVRANLTPLLIHYPHFLPLVPPPRLPPIPDQRHKTHQSRRPRTNAHLLKPVAATRPRPTRPLPL